MGKRLVSEYQLSNSRLADDEIRMAIDDFGYFTSNCMQITDKSRQRVPMHLNKMQHQLFDELLPMVEKATRLDKHMNVVWVKPRQGGGSTGLMSFTNFICALTDMQNMNILHTLPVTDTIENLCRDKVEPIITGVHPDLMPNVERSKTGTMVNYVYKDIFGVPRNNVYSLMSANSSGIRSATLHAWYADECSFYRNPEDLEAAVLGAMPTYGFSLSVFISTFDTSKNPYFLNKIKMARENPDDYILIFTPWFMVYPERPTGIDYNSLDLTEYDLSVIIPELKKYKIAKSEWGDIIDWYHHQRANFVSENKMKQEYPTTITELLEASEDTTVFAKEAIAKQEKNIRDGNGYKFLVDPRTGVAEAFPDEYSPFTIFESPRAGRSYEIVVDPITASSSTSDNFVMHVMDTNNNEQVATFAGKEMDDEDYGDWAVYMAKLYNNAFICPERNVAQGFIISINERHKYYRWWYADKRAKANREIGIRTTVGTKERMISMLSLMLNNENIIIHDKNTLDELKTFVKLVRKRNDGTIKTTMAAKTGKHDDRVAALWIYAGSLDERQVIGRKSSGGILVL